MNAVTTNAAAHLIHGPPKSHAVHRPSDLRRSVSSSVVPLKEGDESAQSSPPGLTHGYLTTHPRPKEHSNGFSGPTTPLTPLRGHATETPISLIHASENLKKLVDDDLSHHPVHTNPAVRAERPGPVRRARSATMMELGVPYKSHSCPIPSCGRLFKRLEHLKRYVAACPHLLALSSYHISPTPASVGAY